jgi:hypothetical protein
MHICRPPLPPLPEKFTISYGLVVLFSTQQNSRNKRYRPVQFQDNMLIRLALFQPQTLLVLAILVSVVEGNAIKMCSVPQQRNVRSQAFLGNSRSTGTLIINTKHVFTCWHT